jgi:hypothetical protein
MSIADGSTYERQYPYVAGGDVTTLPTRNGNRPVPMNPRKEYVAGGYYAFLDPELNLVLSHNRDILSRQFGDEIFDRMMRDPEIAKCINVIKVAVLGDEITVRPSIPRKDPRFERAREISDFCARAIENLERPIRDTLHSLLDALVYGHKVAEVTYQIPAEGVDAGMMTLKSIRVKPRKSVAFVVDRFYRVVGFKAAVRQKVTDEAGTRVELREVVLPREKFLLLTYRGKDEDPRGTSILEAVYNAWNLKMTMWPQYVKWLLQCAIPGLVGTLPPVEERQFLRDKETGKILRDEEGNPFYADEVGTLLTALTDFRNGSVLVIPNGANVEPINTTVNSEPFKTARDVFNEEIEMGLILQTLATSQGRYMARAAAQTHMSVFDYLVVDIKGMLCNAFRFDVIREIVRRNFGEQEAAELLPVVSLGDTERREFAKDITALATLYKSEFISESQKAGIDIIIGLPERDPEADAKYEEERLAREVAAKKALQPEPAPPVAPAAPAGNRKGEE